MGSTQCCLSDSSCGGGRTPAADSIDLITFIVCEQPHLNNTRSRDLLLKTAFFGPGSRISKSPDELPSVPTFQSKSRHSSVSPQDLSEQWFIGLKKAKDTIKNTTQQILCSALLPLAQRYRADQMYERPQIRGVVYTDMMDGQHKSLNGNKYAQVFTTDFHFSAVYPMESKGHARDALKQFIADFGVPDKIICAGSKEQTKRGMTFMEQVRKHHINIHTTEPNRHNQSKVEGVICELRKNWFCTMHRKWVPRRLWDYSLKWVLEVHERTSSDATDLKGRTPSSA